MNTYKLLLILFFLSGYGYILNAQDTIVNPQIKVISFVDSSAVYLRWAVNDQICWRYSNQFGFKLERYTIKRDGKLIENITGKPDFPAKVFKPYPLDEWKSFVDTNNYAGVAAAAIYGEDFEIDLKNTGFMGIVHKSSELENKFGFALFAAEQSLLVAEYSGLFYKDTAVKKNESYLYRISSLIPDTIQKVDTGLTLVDTLLPTVLPPVIQLSAQFEDQKVILKWNARFSSKFFMSYNIERSDDAGITFHRINKKPYVPLNTTGKLPMSYVYVDSLPENKKEYQYRVFGVNSFGFRGPPSDTVKGMGKQELPKPKITNLFHNYKGTIQVEWDFEQYYNSEIIGFTIDAAVKKNGRYKPVVDGILPVQARSASFKALGYANHIQINAIGSDSTLYTSYPPHTIIIPDSVPPLPPTGLKGIIDSSGVVYIKWKPNADKDIFGYRIYRGNRTDDEFSDIGDSTILKPVFIDTIGLDNLTRYIFYKIVAVDRNYNHSDFSLPLKLTKPDTIRPVSPFFTSYSVVDTCIEISWSLSPSPDVDFHLLERQITGTRNWQTFGKYLQNDTTQSAVDCTLYPDLSYQYRISAVDTSGNTSLASGLITAKVPKQKFRHNLAQLSAEVDRTKKTILLKWPPSKQANRYAIYQATSDKAPRLLKFVPAGQNSLLVEKPLLNTHYNYWYKIEFTDGTFSSMSNKLIVNY